MSFLLMPYGHARHRRPPHPNSYGREFCETFFDNVRVPKGNLVGQINKGWTMAKNLPSFERIGCRSPRQAGYALARLKLLAERMGVGRTIRSRTVIHGCAWTWRITRRVPGVRRSGAAPESSLGRMYRMLKIFQTELYQHITETMLEISAEYGGLFGSLEGNRELKPSGLFLQSRPSTIDPLQKCMPAIRQAVGYTP